MLIGGIIAIICLYFIIQHQERIRSKKLKEKRQEEAWITGSDGEKWGYIWAYKLPYPEKKDTTIQTTGIITTNKGSIFDIIDY